MLRVTASTFIQRPLGDVFAYAADPANLPSWVNEILAVERGDDSPLRRGSTFTETIAVRVTRQLEIEYEITELIANETLAFRSTAGIFPMSTRYTFTGEAGGTRVTCAEESEPPGLYYRLIRPMVTWAMRRRLRTELNSLKDTLETDPDEPSNGE